MVGSTVAQSKAEKLVNRDLIEGSNFGWSIAANSSFIAVGGHDASYKVRGRRYKKCGQVVIYKQLQGKWVVGQELPNPKNEDYGWFGGMIVMNENFLVVAASGYSNKETENHRHREGAVYIYKLNKSIDKWQLQKKITSPAPNSSGSFGKKLKLFGDSLGVFYFAGSSYHSIITKQCISFYDLESNNKQPIETVALKIDDRLVSILEFDFNHKLLALAKHDKLWLYYKKNDSYMVCDSVSLDSLFGVERNISSIALHKEKFYIGCHENMDDYWGYKRASNKIKDGDLVVRKTILTDAGKYDQQLIIPHNKELMKKYGITEKFFSEHAHPYEHYASRARRKAGAGYVLYYNVAESSLNLKQTIQPADAHAEDWFGHDIAVNDSNMLISAMGYPDKSENHALYNSRFSGAVYYYTMGNDGIWHQQALLRSKHKKRWDKFGFSLNHWENLFVIGCRFDDVVPDPDKDTETGAGYIFIPPSNTDVSK